MKSNTDKIFHIQYKIDGESYTADIPAKNVREALLRLAKELKNKITVLEITFPVEIK